MSLDEMIRFLRAINHPFKIPYLSAANFAMEIEIWEKRHRPED